MKKILTMIKNLFRKKVKPSKEDGFKDFEPKFGIIIPHDKFAQGASSNFYKTTEYKYALKVASLLHFPHETRDVGGVFGAADRLKKLGCNSSVETHLNAFNGKAEGFELLVMKGDKLSISYANHIVDAFKREFPNKKIRGQNGLKIVESGDRGFNNLVIAKKAGMDIAILSEAFFIDNQNDWITHQEMSKFWNNILK